MNNPLISVIVPIYNVESYLKRCINSIINNSYQNLEIILVNDGSTDHCLEICQYYVSKDERIKLVSKVNGGLSDARNAGIDIAKGEYISFIDSDDYIHPDLYKDMIKLCLSYDAQIVEFGVRKVYNNEYISWENGPSNEKVLNHDQALYHVLDYQGMIVAWNKLYRSNLFEKIRFPYGKLNEDEFTIPYLVDKVNNFVITNNQYYAYEQRGNSIMNSKFNLKRLDCLEAHETRISYFNYKYDHKYNFLMLYHYFVACTILLQETKQTKEYKKVISNIKRKQDFAYNQIIHIDNKSNVRKIKTAIYRWFPWIIRYK